MKSIAVIVLTWNDWKNTINCLETIYGNDYSKFDIIIVNNNSTYNHISKIINWSKNKILPDDPHIKVNKIKKIEIRNILASAKINKILKANFIKLKS